MEIDITFNDLRMGQGRLHVRIKPAAEGKVRAGHPWVYADSVREQNREGHPGELAVIFDSKNKFLAIGLFDPDSPIRVRILHRGTPAHIDQAWWRSRLLESLQLRAGIADASTNALRLIHGENDGFPALVLDRYDDTLVLKIYSNIWFNRLEEITALFRAELNPARMVLRLSRNIQTAAGKAHRSDGEVIYGAELDSPVVFQETGLRFEADVVKGQKTGFFLDQRENRRQIAQFAPGKKVLNAFSFSGGFSLYAAQAGATSVTDVDISPHALESARRNFALNTSPALRHCRHLLLQADVFEWLESAPRERFDVVILDPPSLARRKGEQAGALRAYSNLARAAMNLINARGLIACFSCSAHVKAEDFFATVQNAARVSGKDFQVLLTTREPRDHHAVFPEAEYLKGIYLQAR